MANEKLLIDIEEIVKVAEHAYEQWSLAMVGADDTRKINEVFKKQYLCKVVKAVAENCPTVDAVEVVHGRWEDEYGGAFANPRYRCSLCKEKALYRHEQNSLGGWEDVQALTDYCPNCGAKMKGE